MSRTGELLWWLACAAVGLLLCAWALGLLEGCRGDGKKRQGPESALFSWIFNDPRVSSQLTGNRRSDPKYCCIRRALC